jgi:iron complex outermembrane receptor protein
MWCSAQHDSTQSSYRLQEVEIRHKLSANNPNNGFSVAEQLSLNANVFIRQYSPGSLAASTIRGTYNVHTPVFWNGFDISNPMTGQQDLSLLPLTIGNILLQTGNLQAQTTMPNIGGAIQIQSDDISETLAQLRLGAGSFGGYHTQAKAQICGERMNWRIRFFDNRAANNFVYRTPESSQSNRREHAAFAMQGIVLDQQWQISMQEKLSTSIWLQHNRRQLPGSIHTQLHEERQNDNSYRFTTHYQNISNKGIYGIKLGAFREYFYYINPLIRLESTALTHRWQPEAYWQLQEIAGFTPELNVGSQYQVAQTSNYAGENKTIIIPYSGLQVTKNTLRWAHHFFVQGSYFHTPEQMLFAPSTLWRSNYRWSEKWQTKAAITYKYRLPTLNEMYWQPNGNPSIAPEQAQNNEMGMSYINGGLQCSIQGFYNFIRQYVAWQPDMSGFWSPVNIGNIQARGAELDVKYSATIQKWLFSVGGMGNFTRSTMSDGPHQNKQLIYMPMWNSSTFMSISNNNFGCTWRQQYTGTVFTTFDHTEHLEAFMLSSFECNYNTLWPGTGARVEAFFRVQNLFNTAYSLMPGFPMPGRYFQTGIQFQFNYKNKTNL